ncbi:ribokinase [Pelobacter seleniigenes]|uniref:ribokinase n=1 Tax=Pelobacter seleniigenes TaxID=407188 RepID=UPI0004A75FD0|nr:ribokinase [Pelobacter seleniigenes]
MSITVFGSLNMDLTAYVATLPRPGATAHAQNYTIGLGGKGANQAVAAQRLSEQPVRLVAAIGADAFGIRAQELLAGFKVSTEQLRIMPEEDTGIALIHVDANAQNTITVVGGANLAWPDEGPDPAVFRATRIALFQLETPLPATLAAMQQARNAGAGIILDPAPAPDQTGDAEIQSLLELADIVTPNESEAESLTGLTVADRRGALQAAHALRARGAAAVVVKRGVQGLVYVDKDWHEGEISAFKVATVDSVGAGDCFNGALAVALTEGRPFQEALHFAAAAAALSTEKPGAAAAAPERTQVESLLRKKLSV